MGNIQKAGIKGKDFNKDFKASPRGRELAANRWAWFRYVRSLPGLESHAKNAASALAESINVQDGNPRYGLAWPEHETIASLCGFSKRHAQRGLTILERAGLISIKCRGGGLYRSGEGGGRRGCPCLYELRLPEGVSLPDAKGGQVRPPYEGEKVDINWAKGGHKRARRWTGESNNQSIDQYIDLSIEQDSDSDSLKAMTLAEGLPSGPRGPKEANKEGFPSEVKLSFSNPMADVPRAATGNGQVAPIVPPTIAIPSGDSRLPEIESYARSVGAKCQHTRYSCLVPTEAYEAWAGFQTLTANSSRH